MRLPAVIQMAKSAPGVIARNGLRHSLHLASICLVVPALQTIVPWAARAYLKLRGWKRRTLAAAEVSAWKKRWDDGPLLEGHHDCVTLEILGLNADQEAALRNELAQSPEVELGPIDQDGFLLTRFDSLTAVPTIARENFVQRTRFDLRLVVLENGLVGIKKWFKGNRLCFLNELEAITELATAACDVPTILNVDFDSLTIIVSFIPGSVLREEVAKRGARIRDRDVDRDPAFEALSPEQGRRKRIEAAKTVLGEVIDTSFVERLFGMIQTVHSRGIILFDIKYGNIILERNTGAPFLIDFDAAIKLPNPRGWLCRTLRDHDIEEFNLHFDTDKPTYARLRRRIRSREAPLSSNWYAPAYFGSGLRIGPIWSVHSGYGRWHYILKSNLPIQDSRRILDLGTNNGFYAMELLRRGAVEVIGVEPDKTRVAQAQFVRAAFEWADNRTYNFRMLHANVADVVSMDLGRFDMVIALCSIYYLEDDDISRVVRHVSGITDCFVWQCNLERGIDRGDERTYQQASVEYTLAALEQNGFPVTKVVAPQGYWRPLVIGSKT